MVKSLMRLFCRRFNRNKPSYEIRICLSLFSLFRFHVVDTAFDVSQLRKDRCVAFRFLRFVLISISDECDIAEYNTWFDSLQDVLDENTAGNLLNMITALSARVDLIEAVVFNDITENPFLILFDDLSGVNTTGVWNENLQRIESLRCRAFRRA